MFFGDAADGPEGIQQAVGERHVDITTLHDLGVAPAGTDQAN